MCHRPPVRSYVSLIVDGVAAAFSLRRSGVHAASDLVSAFLTQSSTDGGLRGARLLEASTRRVLDVFLVSFILASLSLGPTDGSSRRVLICIRSHQPAFSPGTSGCGKLESLAFSFSLGTGAYSCHPPFARCETGAKPVVSSLSGFGAGVFMWVVEACLLWLL